MKKLVSILLVVTLCLGCLAGCTTDKPDEEQEGSKLIGVCMQNMSSSISELEATALKETFEPLGYEVQIASADDSVSNQTQQIQNFILMGAEMLVVLPCEIETLEDVLLEAREAGIKVVISGGTGTISEDAYDAVSCDDEFMIGMYVASIAKTWVEANMDPNGDWDVAFLSSTISVDAKSRCAGEAMILEPWLKNEAGEYVNLMGETVDEADRVANPVYCEMIASRVDNYQSHTTEMDISGDNRTVVAGVLTDNAKVRVIIAYNSLVSTAGSQYIMDTYPESEQGEFAFFSGGVMGDEYEYLIGAVSALSEGSPVQLGSQGVYRMNTAVGGNFGAFTTNRPASIVKAMGCTSTLIGHCEERNDKKGILAEAGVTDMSAVNRLLNQEIRCAQDAGLTVLYCIGETSEEQGNWEAVLGQQLDVGLEGVDKSRVVIGYEPVWSIGPGKTPAGKEYITKIARFVKERTGGMDVVYGGGLKTDNAAMLASIPEIDGGLIALTRFQGEIGFYPEEYLEIIRLYLGE